MHKGSTEWPRLVRFTIIVCVLAGSLMLIVGCGSTTGTSGGASAEVIKVGMLWPLTGDLAKLGQDCRNACVLAADQINQAGGIKSMGGAKIELVSADTQSKPDVGLGECRRLIEQENVSVITGTYQSSLALPATEICERGKCPILLGIAAADEVTERGLKYTFRAGTTTTLYGQNQVDLALALPDLVEGGYSSPKKFALLYEDSDFGQAIAVATKEYLAEKGLSLVADVSYSASSVDLTTQVAKVKAANPDVVLTTALLQRLAAVRGRLSLCADQAAAAKWWLSMPMASVSAEGPMPKALSTRRTSPLMPGCRHQGRACPLRRARMTSNPLIVA